MTTPPVKSATTGEKKDVQKLQRAIIDGLEDVKAQDIQVYDTEHLTALFERVIIASGTSNRQTKALAASVRDAVRDAGFAKPRMEGEENGEWIIVDCGAAVAHIMQPTIRQYYHLEELWGDKPVKIKLGAPAPLPRASEPMEAPAAAARKKPAAKKVGAKTASKSGARGAGKPAKPPPPMPRDPESGYAGKLGKSTDWTAKRNASDTASEPVVKAPRASTKTAAAKTPAAKTAAGKVAAPRRIPVVTVPASKKVQAEQAAVKKAPAKKAPVAAAKTAAKAAAKPAVKSAVKPAAKSVAKPAAKKAAPRKTASRDE